MAKAPEDRNTFLERLLGKKNAADFKNRLVDARKIARSAGVEMKEWDEVKVKGVLEDIVSQIDAIIAPLTDKPPEGLADEILAIVMGKLAEIPVGEPAEEPEEEMPIETMVADEEEDAAEEEEEDEKKKPMERFAELSAQVKALALESTAATKDMRELIPHFVTMAKAVEQLAPLVEKSSEVDTLKSRIAALEKQLSGRPRAASTAADTLFSGHIPGNGASAEQIKTEISKGIEGESSWLGTPLKGKSS